MDNLGIVVKQEEAQERYAAMLGKSTKELTAQEKAQALQVVTLQALKEEMEKVGEVPLTMAERQAQLNATWENTKTVLGEALVPLLEKLLDFVQPLLEKVADFISKNSEQVASFMKWAAGIAAVVAGFSGLALALPAITTAIGILTGPIGIVIGAIVALAAARKNNRGGIQEKTHEVIEYIKPYIEQFIETIKAFWEEHGTQILTGIFAFWDLIKALIANAVDIIATTIEGLFTAL